MTIEFEFSAGDAPSDMQDALRQFADVVEEELLDEFDDMMEEIRKRVQNLAPVDTGRLRDSYEDMVETIRDGIEGKVETDVPYAPFQEFLAFGKSHLGPAFEEAKPIFENGVETAWNRAVRRVS